MDRNKKDKKSTGFLKFCGVLMILGGALGIINGIAALIGETDKAIAGAGSGALGFSAILVTISGVLAFIGGIVCVKFADNPKKIRSFVIFGVIVAVLTVGSQILSLYGGGRIGILACVTGLVVPALYTVTAIRHLGK